MNPLTEKVSDSEERLRKQLEEVIDRAFAEDMSPEDVTTNAVAGPGRRAEAVWVAKQQGTLAGLDFSRQVFLRLDPDLEWKALKKDGEAVEQGDLLARFSGSCRAILSAERTALNIAQRLSGIATATSKMVALIDGLPVHILDTRKTAPGLRYLDKYAVKMGGGLNHRMGLYDMAMIKDNHIVAAGGITVAVDLVKRYRPGVRIEVETTSLAQVREALSCNVDMIMLDNMDVEEMKKAVDLIDGRAKTEASGNLSHHNIRAVAETGVDYISSGALTHSVEAFDISQQIKQII